MAAVLTVLGTALALSATTLLATPVAGAHSELIDTDPAPASVVERPPAALTLRFSGDVEADTAIVGLYDGTGSTIAIPRARHRGDRTALTATLPRLAPGGYVVTWRVVSADGHPVRGAFTFRIGAGAAAPDPGLLERLVAADGGDTAVGVVFGLNRFLAFVALAVLVGVPATTAGLRPDRLSRTRSTVAAAWSGVAVTTVAGLGLQGASGAGRPLADALSGALVADVLGTRFGRMSAARLVLLVLAAPLLWVLTRPGPEPGHTPTPARPVPVARPVLAALGLLGAGLILTVSLAGHAGSRRGAVLASAVDATHLGAVALWLGGLVAVSGWWREQAAPALSRFSRLATIAVATIALTGIAQAARQVGGRAALTGTTYGRLLLVKVALFAVAVALAALSRATVRRARTGRPTGDQSSVLRRAVAGELAIGAAVLAVTALLVASVPARDALARPASSELRAGAVRVEVVVDPARAGRTTVHAYTLDTTGRPVAVASLRLRLSLPTRDIGPLLVPVTRAGPGHFVGGGVDIPIRGAWTIDVTIRTEAGDRVEGRGTIEVR